MLVEHKIKLLIVDDHSFFRQGVFRSDKSMLEKLYDGEDHGIAKVEKIIDGDLDATSYKMVQKILNADHDHLKKLHKMINSKS